MNSIAQYEGEFVRLKTFIEVMDAHILRARLEAEGIRCYIRNEHLISIDPLYSNALGGAQLWVFHSQLNAALEILDDIERQPFTNESDQQIFCPSCHSSHLIAGHRSYRGISGFFSMFVALLTSTFPIYHKEHFKCRECGKEFTTRI